MSSRQHKACTKAARKCPKKLRSRNGVVVLLTSAPDTHSHKPEWGEGHAPHKCIRPPPPFPPHSLPLSPFPLGPKPSLPCRSAQHRESKDRDAWSWRRVLPHERPGGPISFLLASSSHELEVVVAPSGHVPLASFPCWHVPSTRTSSRQCIHCATTRGRAIGPAVAAPKLISLFYCLLSPFHQQASCTAT